VQAGFAGRRSHARLCGLCGFRVKPWSRSQLDSRGPRRLPSGRLQWL